MPAAPEVSFAKHGERVLTPEDVAANTVVFPLTAVENPQIPIVVQAAYGDIVAIASIRLGSIGDRAIKQLRAAISSDGGRSWHYHDVSTRLLQAGFDSSVFVDATTGHIHIIDEDQYTSDDGGTTWQTSQTVQRSVGKGAVVELADGTLYMSSRTYKFNGQQDETYSYDGAA